MYTAEFTTDSMSGGFVIVLVYMYNRNAASLRGGLEINVSAANSDPKEQAEAV